MKFRKAVALAILLTLITPSIATAAKKPTPAATYKITKVVLAKPDLITNLSGGAGDQISAAITTPSSIILTGTVESNTAGGSDGYLVSYNLDLTKSFELRLGGSGDEIATALVSDKSGNIWVAGAQSTATSSQASATESATVNVDNVSTTAVTKPAGALTQLTLWKVSPTGQLLATYSTETGGVVFPNSLVQVANGFRIMGNLNDQFFSTTVDANGIFGNLLQTTTKPKPPVSPEIIKAGTGNLKSYISKGAIAGIPSWKPKSPTPVLIGYSKSGLITRANYFQGKVLDVFYITGFGPIVITERSDGYGLIELGLAK